MLIINGNEMRLTKGDDADIVCNVDVDGEAYTPSAGDVFTLTVRKFPTSDSNVCGVWRRWTISRYANAYTCH